MSKSPTISFIGAGNMASAIFGGMIDGGYPADAITATSPDETLLAPLHERYGIQTQTDNAAAVANADVVVLGVSRTSKTPTSIYLANRGFKVANIPIVQNVPLPQDLMRAKKPLIVGLIASVDRISHVRQNRVLGRTEGFQGELYTDRSLISEEIKYARTLCDKNNWPLIDVTRRSIEETAAAILALRPKWR